MPRGLVLIASAIVVWSTTGIAVQREAGSFILDASTRARFLRPGEVVLLTVKPSRQVVHVAGEGFGVAIELWPAGESGEWQGLVGVPLGTAPGAYDIVLRAADRTDTTATTTVSLNIQRGKFATRRITVNERFVEPPASVAARIAREAKTLEDLFAQSREERLWRGPFSMPVAGRSTSSYGRLTVLNGKPGSRHRGADFRAALGTPVRAPNSGMVVLASDLYFAGGTVVLDHGNGLVSLFAHLSQIAVEVGTRVAKGDPLGEAGATGRVTGPHLHWAMRLHGTSVDPLSLSVAVAELQD